MYNKERTPEHKRDDNLEGILSLLNVTLEDDEADLINKFNSPKYPVVFIVGNARCGTTLLYQLLASTGLFAYPSNIISRFYNAPYIGALIHKIFVDYDKFGELLGDQDLSFNSTLGKTKGPISPHEFWYFWRRFFRFEEIQKLSEQELADVDAETFVQELAAMEGAFEKPLVLKGMILNWNLGYLKKIIPNAIFLHLKRREVFNMQSLFKARLKYFGNIDKWYSFKPPEYYELKNKSIYEQLAGQVRYTNIAINKQLQEIESGDFVTINYEQVCSNPQKLYSAITDVLSDKGVDIQCSYTGPQEFEHHNKLRLEAFNPEKAQKAIDKLII